jgi:hypothetical protein
VGLKEMTLDELDIAQETVSRVTVGDRVRSNCGTLGRGCRAANESGSGF